MPSALDMTESPSAIKLLFMGDSGMGKTGALASLVLAGYHVRLLDFDNGHKILIAAIKQQAKTPEELRAALGRLHIEVCTDKLRTVGGKAIVDGSPKAWANAMNLLNKWGEFGNVSTWPLNTIVVIDSLSFMALSAMRFHMVLSGKGAETPKWQDFRPAQDLVRGALDILYSDSVKCNVIVNAHINLYEVKVPTDKVDTNGNPIMKTVEIKGLPQGLGQAMSPEIPRYFNTTLIATMLGTQRVISTQAVGMTQAKTEILNVPKTFPLSSGLADYFRLIQGDPLSL